MLILNALHGNCCILTLCPEPRYWYSALEQVLLGSSSIMKCVRSRKVNKRAEEVYLQVHHSLFFRFHLNFSGLQVKDYAIMFWYSRSSVAPYAWNSDMWSIRRKRSGSQGNGGRGALGGGFSPSRPRTLTRGEKENSTLDAGERDRTYQILKCVPLLLCIIYSTSRIGQEVLFIITLTEWKCIWIRKLAGGVVFLWRVCANRLRD